MSNKNVRRKMQDRSSNDKKTMGWIRLAEDAEQDIAREKLRLDNLATAARIFRMNAEKGIPFPLEQQHAD
jgi:hypothetical protein